jgi:hypothetical protein
MPGIWPKESGGQVVTSETGLTLPSGSVSLYIVSSA